jgi:hypothetical protein
MQQRVIIYERSFHSNFKQVLTTLFILQLLPKANPTGQLLEVQLLRDLFRDWRHLLQKLLVLLICTIGGYSSLLTVKIRQPSHEFTFGVGMSFIPYPLVLTPVV